MSFSSLKITSLQRFSLNFAANIIAAFMMLAVSVRAFNWVKPSFAQFLCFLTTALLANGLFAWLATDTGSSFNEQGLIAYLVWPFIILVAGVIIAGRLQNQALTFIPVVLWLAADTLSMILQSFIQFLGMQNWLPHWLYEIIPAVFILLFVWQSASLLLIFAKKLEWSLLERLLVLVGTIVLLVVWQKNVANEPIFKVKNPAPTLAEYDFYTQNTLLESALTSLEKGQLGVSEWYFLGVAGYAGQDVFASEIAAARQLFDVRFGTAGRSIALVNNPYTVKDLPIASRTSLSKALNKIGEKMNSEEDVLFLTLTSHGIVGEDNLPTGELAIENPPLELDPIDGKWLKETLDKAGIRWRVIVVSACYSGSFIKDLANPNTVIITASRDDRASFGCTNDADLTYFGRAFFEESLRSQTSFEKAFNHTVRRVGEKEALMGFTPSEPQMSVGSLMKTALPEFEKVLFGYGINPKTTTTKNESE